MKRINVVGTSGSGKSTFSRSLAEKLSYPYLELDAMFWLPNWQHATDAGLLAAVEKQTAQCTWVLDGNYTRTAQIKWMRADTIIWIDYSFIRTIYQAVKRALIYAITKQELWSGTGNKESFKKSFFSKNSIILWTLYSYKINKERYTELMADPNYQHITFVRLRSPKESRTFLEGLSS